MRINQNTKKIFALILTFALLFTTVLNSLWVLADGDVTFNLTPRITQTYSVSAGQVTMPEHIAKLRLICYSNWYNNAKTRVAGWTNDATGDFYAAGTTVDLPGGTTLSPVFYDGDYDFNGRGITAGMTLNSSSVNENQNLNLSSKYVSIVDLGDGNNCVQFDSNASNSDTFLAFTPAYKDATIKDENGGTTGDYFFTGYNLDAKYKVTFKYKRTDATDNDSKIYVAFGTGAQKSHNGTWASASKTIKKEAVVTTKKAMDDFEEVTAIVTAPNTYIFSGESNEYRSGAVGFGVSVPKNEAGVQIQIDDFKIESFIGKNVAEFDYPDNTGDASFVDSVEFFDTDGNVTLPVNETAMNLYWKNGGNTYEAGETVNVSALTKNADGYYTFTAFFGDVTLDFDEFDTEPFSFNENGSGLKESSTGFFTQLSKDNNWRIPAGYANDGKNTAFGAKGFSIKKNSEKGGNSLYLGSWKGSESGSAYKNAVFFTHTPFDETDPNSHNSNASGKVNYSYVYFTPGQQYTVTFDYKIDKTSGNGNPPFNATIGFGIGTANGNCSYNTIQYADDSTFRDGITLKEDSTSWEKAAITLTAPSSYTGNGTTSARMGLSLDVHTGGGMVIDNIEISTGTAVYFKYPDVAGASAALGGDFCAFADVDGILTLPKTEADNLVWENGNKYYLPGTTVNVDDLGVLEFNAVFGGSYQDFENINTNTVKLVDGTESKNLYEELSRNPSYWKVPVGLSNVKSGSNYGTALGHDRMGVLSGKGKSGKGLQLVTDKTYTAVAYRNAALFRHSPTSFGTDDTIEYSYVYYEPGKEYTMEFDYKAADQIDVAVAFGIDYSKYSNSATNSVSMSDFDAHHITLASTSSWKHASITVTAPASYTGNGVTSARVGIAVKDSAVYTDTKTYDYFDNISFYPTDEGHLGQMSFDYCGYEEGEFTTNYPFYQSFNANQMTIPTGLKSTGTFVNGGTWTVSGGDAKVEGWLCNETGKYYEPGATVNKADVPANATFSAVYGNSEVNFDDLDGVTIYDGTGSNGYAKSYGSDRVTIETEDNNSFVRFTGNVQDANNIRQMSALYKNGTNDYRLLGYNKDTKYKVTFKYRRTDTTDIASDLYVVFGIPTVGWRANDRCIQVNKVATTEKGMTEFVEVSAIVTSPDTYTYDAESTPIYTKVVGVGVQLTNGVVVEIDDFKIESAVGNSYVTLDKNIGDNEATHQMLESGEELTDLPELTYDGFEFCGWYDNRLGNGSEVTSLYGNGEAHNLYAKWVPTLSGSSASFKINGSALSNYQVVLPSNKTLVLADSLKNFKNLITSKGAVTTTKSRKINIEDTSSKTLAGGQSSYTIKVENGNLNITATDDAAMAGALDRLSQFINTAYEKGKTLNFASDFEFTQNYVADESQYSYSWSDEFSSTDLDKSVWLKNAGNREPSVSGYQIGDKKASWTQELAGKTDDDLNDVNKTTGHYTINSQGVFVDNGSAVIRTERVNQSDKNGNTKYFLNRSMSTIGSVQYTYGAIEIKAKLPSHPAAPSIWLYSSENIDTTAEIDLHEGIGTVSGYENDQQIVSNLHASYHYSKSNNKWKTALDESQPLNSGAASGKRIYLGTSKTDFDNDYHIFSVKWTPDEVVFALDGEAYYTYNFNTSKDLINNAKTYDGNSPFSGLTADQIKDCFSKPMYVCFGNSMASYHGTYGPIYTESDPTQLDLKVDYVRIYQSESNKGTAFQNRRYTVSEIATVEQAEKAFMDENGIDNRGSTTKTVTVGTETVKINYGDYLPVNYKIGNYYIYGWSDGTKDVKTYKDTSKTYTPKYIDISALNVTYKIANVDSGKADVLFDLNISQPVYGALNPKEVGFVYSEKGLNEESLKKGKGTTVSSKKVYSNGIYGTNFASFGDGNNLACAINTATTGRANDITIRSYIMLPDNRIIYGDVVTISKGTTLKASGGLTALDIYIAKRLAEGKELENAADYNGDKVTDIRDLVNLTKKSGVSAEDLSACRKILLFYDDTKVKLLEE